MSQADELLTMLTDEEIAAYSNNSGDEPHIVISSDRYITVPDSLKRIAVQYDHNVETVTFDCPRYWDEIDMSTMAIYINFTLSNGSTGTYAATNITIDENDSTIMHFDWTILQDATLVDGPLSFLVCIKSVEADGHEETHWHSELNRDMYISEGLKTKSTTVNETEFDIVSQLLNRVNEMGNPSGSTPNIDYGNISNAVKGTAEGSVVSLTDISPLEHTVDVRLKRKNLFDISKVVSTAGSNYVVNNGDGTLSISPTSTTGAGVTGKTPSSLSDYAPELEIGKTYTLSFNTTASQNYIYLKGYNGSWFSGRSVTITQAMLDSRVYWYATTNTTATISNIQIEEGTVVTEYAPYVNDLSEVTVKQYDKNLIPYPYSQTTRTESGVTWTDNGDGIIVANGTASVTSFFLLGGSWSQGGANSIFEDGKTYRLSTNLKTEDAMVFVERTDKQTGKISYLTEGSAFTINKTQYDYNNVCLQVKGGATVNNLIIYVCLEIGSVSSATNYIPNVDGTIEGITYIYPTTTLVPDTNGVVINCTYNKDINKVAVSGGGVPTELTNKVNKNTTDIVTNRNLIDLNTRDISDLQAYLGYDDNDILGLEADFENRTFTRLAGAAGLEAGEEFNRFSMYRDRVRCNVADDGTITALYGDVGEVILFDGDVKATSNTGTMGAAPHLGSGHAPAHPSYQDKAITVEVTAGDQEYVYTSTLAAPMVRTTLGTFVDSTGAEITLDYQPFATSNMYDGYFHFFLTPYTADTIHVKIRVDNVGTFRDDGANGQVMVYQPKFYYRVVPMKLEKQEDGLGYNIRKARYYISATPKPGFKPHPAFIDSDGNELSYILYSAYEGSMRDASKGVYANDGTDTSTELDLVNDRLCSVSGVKPISGKYKNLTRANFETLAKARGDGWHIETIQAVSANQLLMLIELGSTNLQPIIGTGVVGLYNTETYNGASITGSTSALGNATGKATATISEVGGVETVYTTNNFLSISYRGIENPYGNIWTCVEGINIWGDSTMGGGQAYITDKTTFTESVRDGDYEAVGFSLPNVRSGYATALGYGKEKFDWLLIGSETAAGGDSNFPIGDSSLYEPNQNTYGVACIGHCWTGGYAAGGFSWHLYYNPAVTVYTVGARLLYLPSSTKGGVV